MKNEYKIKLFLDKDKKPIIPFTTLDTVFKDGSDQTLADLLANVYTKSEVDAITDIKQNFKTKVITEPIPEITNLNTFNEYFYALRKEPTRSYLFKIDANTNQNIINSVGVPMNRVNTDPAHLTVTLIGDTELNFEIQLIYCSDNSYGVYEKRNIKTDFVWDDTPWLPIKAGVAYLGIGSDATGTDYFPISASEVVALGYRGVICYTTYKNNYYIFDSKEDDGSKVYFKKLKLDTKKENLIETILTVNDTKIVTIDTVTVPLSSGAGASDYPDLTNKPKVNGVELVGDKTSTDLNLVGAKYLKDGVAKGEVFNDYSADQRAEGLYSCATGKSNLAFGNYCSVGGYDNYITTGGNYSFAHGRYLNVNGEDSASFGFGNNVGGSQALTTGYNNTNHANYSFMCGRYGLLESDKTPYFAVANGTGNTSSDQNIGMMFCGTKGEGKLYVEHKKVITENNEGTVGQFLVSDGAGGANWTTVPTAEGGSF